ncbi:hypothetical protein ACWCL1_06510 [Ligilactobacillus sp. LYQ135]
MKPVKYRQYIYVPLLFLLTGLLYLSKFANTEVVTMGLVGNLTFSLILFIRIFATSPHSVKRMSTLSKMSTIWSKYFSYIFSTLLVIMTESVFFSALTAKNTPIVVIYVVVETTIVVLSYVNNIKWIRYKYTKILNQMSEEIKQNNESNI